MTGEFSRRSFLKYTALTAVAVAGFKDIHTGKIEEIMLIKNEADLDTFRKMYGIEGKIEKEY